MNDQSEKIKEILFEKLGCDREELTNEASLLNDLGADSLDVIEIIMEFEKEFGFQIPDADAEKLETVGQVIEYLNKRVSELGV